MKEIGAYEAKTHLSRLLDEVERGERFVITKHGRPLALLTPVGARPDAAASGEVLAAFRGFRAGKRLGNLSLSAMIREGRR